MLYHALFAGLGLAGLAATAPVTKANDQASGPQNVVYWGASGSSSKPLSDYCEPNAGVDILVMSFLENWGVSGDIPSGALGGCTVNPNGSFDTSACSTLASQIKTCQSAGKKVLVSLGGQAGVYSLLSQSQGEKIGQYLWDAYGKPGNATVQRPFGDVAVDGWDFDLEHSKDVDPLGSQWYQYLVSTLRSNFAKDSKRYYITGAPQCTNPDLSVGDAIKNSVFDYLFVQFYNNNPACSLGMPSTTETPNGIFNYNQWVETLSSSKSSNAKIFVGAPSSKSGATGSDTGAKYYASPSQLATIIKSVKSDSHFGGVMLWDASYSDQNVIAGCTFAQQTKSILTTGRPCKGTPDDGGSPPTYAPPASNSTVPSPPAYSPPAYSAPASSSSPPATSSVVYPPPASTSPASSPPDNSSVHASGNGGGVAEWGQCGGTGYTGPTECQAPFECQGNANWKACKPKTTPTTSQKD